MYKLFVTYPEVNNLPRHLSVVTNVVSFQILFPSPYLAPEDIYILGSNRLPIWSFLTHLEDRSLTSPDTASKNQVRGVP